MDEQDLERVSQLFPDHDKNNPLVSGNSKFDKKFIKEFTKQFKTYKVNQTVEDYYKIGEKVAERFWEHYEEQFKLAQHDLDDLKQETALAIVKVLTKYENQITETFHFVILQACVWSLTTLLHQATNYNKVSHSNEISVDPEVDNDTPKRSSLVHPSTIDPNNDQTPNPTFLWCDLRRELPFIEYKLLQLKILKGMTYEEIRLTLYPNKGYTNMAIQKKFSRILKKVKKMGLV